MEKLDLKTELELELEQAWGIKAIVYYGKESQSIVAIEELSELQKELCKMLRGIGKHRALSRRNRRCRNHVMPNQGAICPGPYAD